MVVNKLLVRSYFLETGALRFPLYTFPLEFLCVPLYLLSCCSLGRNSPVTVFFNEHRWLILGPNMSQHKIILFFFPCLNLNHPHNQKIYLHPFTSNKSYSTFSLHTATEFTIICLRTGFLHVFPQGPHR